MILLLARIVPLLLLFSSLACRPLKIGVLSDIYLEDKSSDPQGNDRRHAASAEEILWTVHLSGCSGMLLTPRYVLTAHHCEAKVGDRLRSGWSILTLGSVDLEVAAVVEDSTSLDYALLEVRWLTPTPKNIPYPPRLATIPADVYVSNAVNEGDELFTVGFPDDRAGIWSSTYAEGQAKAVNGTQLFFNVGVINGSSGGGVLKKETNMLVSLANGGRHNVGEPGWDQADKENPKTWNYGTPLWLIYGQSRLLPQLFPQGVNAFYGDTFQPKTRIYLALVGEGKDSGLWLAASELTQELLICSGYVSDCNKNKSGFIAAKAQGVSSGRAFYQSPISPETLPSMTLVALDKNGSVIGQRQALVKKGK